jgi:hypothetical protein
MISWSSELLRNTFLMVHRSVYCMSSVSPDKLYTKYLAWFFDESDCPTSTMYPCSESNNASICLNAAAKPETTVSYPFLLLRLL